MTANRRGLATSFWRTVATAQAHVTAGHEGDTSIRASTTFSSFPSPLSLPPCFQAPPSVPFRLSMLINMFFSSNLEASGKEYNIGNNIGY